ncbi:hypothetical protein CtesDRAFT_PD1599 [Comamonas testosteroni KF-1]|uniref:Uncharacterized protein n=1 Tax=Comamonas testosteroni (strain DSM 14576 / KF-1) TaxID=399795 RepID=B7X3H2_COMTK|nr:hypothetical protein CtesDRAFT_PD1599 [Comamonas testosteroni KF-1]
MSKRCNELLASPILPRFTSAVAAPNSRGDAVNLL